MPGLYQALGGSQPSAVQQPSAPLPAGSPAVGSGSPQLPGLFEALQGQQASRGSSPLELGSMIASNSAIPVNVRNNVPRDFGQQAPAPVQHGVGANSNPDDYENKANSVMNAYEAKNRKEHPEWYK